jgi:iron complex transport system substrate-binding protein
MSDNKASESTEAPTRRDTIKYGGAVVGGSLLAGCASQSGPQSTPTQTNAGDESYSVTMKPHGATTFSEVPETYASRSTTWTEIGFLLTGEEPVAMEEPGAYPSYFYDPLPGVEFDTDQPLNIASEDSGWEKEVFYEAGPDVSLIDPNVAKHYGNWEDDGIEEIETNVSPFAGSFARRPFPEYDEGYPFYSLYECLEKGAEVFNVKQERFEPLNTIHDDLIAQIQSNIPDEPPTIGYLNGIPSDDIYYIWKPGLPGVQGGVQRTFGFNDAFSGTYPSAKNSYETDIETLLETDPDTILIKSGITVADILGYDSFPDYVDALLEGEVGSELTAVEEGRVYAGGPLVYGPVQSLFAHEIVAKQFYPEQFGEFSYETPASLNDIPEDEHLFDRQRLADIINGDL